MRWAETCGLCAGLLLTGHAFADAPTYGKAQTFEPGQKYNCVPTADHKGWDCSESGKAAQPHPAPAAAPAPAAPRPETPPAQASAPAAPQPAAAAQKAGALPDYLTNAAARGDAPPPVAESQAASPTSAPASATAHSAAADNPATSAQSAPTPAKTVPPPVAEQSTRPPTPPRVAENPEASPALQSEPTAVAPKPLAPTAAETAPPSAVRAQPSPHGPQPAAADFLALPGDQFVVELAHTGSASDLAAQRSALQLPRGKVYELHLRQNGIDSWLLVWGTFDSIEAARAARDELAAQGSVTPGWPRRVAPLQAEARRASD
jgi:septal ring-binding cell division protein DamX